MNCRNSSSGLSKIIKTTLASLTAAAGLAGCESYYERPVYYSSPASVSQPVQQQSNHLSSGIVTGSKYIDFNQNGMAERNEIVDMGKLLFKSGEPFIFMGCLRTNSPGIGELKVFDGNGNQVYTSGENQVNGPTALSYNATTRLTSEIPAHLTAYLYFNGNEVSRSTITVKP